MFSKYDPTLSAAMLSGWRRVQVVFSALQQLAKSDVNSNCVYKVASFVNFFIKTNFSPHFRRKIDFEKLGTVNKIDPKFLI